MDQGWGPTVRIVLVGDILGAVVEVAGMVAAVVEEVTRGPVTGEFHRGQRTSALSLFGPKRIL